MGFVNLTADGLAMGVGDFMSSRAENQYVKNERKREEWYNLHFQLLIFSRNVTK